MRYHALACDYDGTIATDGRVTKETSAALEALLASGRKLILVTGRELDDLRKTFSRFDLFEWIVAENGAVLFCPGRSEERVLCAPPPERFVELLRQRGVAPISVGRAIVATWHPYESVVLEAIRELGLELQVIFNKDAVMVLPATVNKASGLTAALETMGLSAHNIVGAGDAENDHAFLQLCECAVAVANALPAVKERADLVTAGDHGKGVEELIRELLQDDLACVEGTLRRHHLVLGKTSAGADVSIAPFGTNVLIAGPSGSGKSTAATALLERLATKHYQFCVIDPEGDYDGLDIAVSVGTSHQAPDIEHALDLLKDPKQSISVNLLGVQLADRPEWFLKLFARLQEMRARTSRPHWLLLDEAHHLLPASWRPGAAMSHELDRLLFVTVHPDSVAPTMLSSVDTVIAVGGQPEETIGEFCATVGEDPPKKGSAQAKEGEVVLWKRGETPLAVHVTPAQADHQRHIRKYAEGELAPEKSFYFRGRDGKLNLRAQNLMLFLQLAEGVDDDTWLFHLQRGDYSSWFREFVKDEALAKEAERVAGDKALSPQESRQQIRAAVERNYTLPEKSGK